jgi:hypothetical protein
MSHLQSCKKHSGVCDVTDPLLFFYPTLLFPPAPRASRRMDVYPGVAKEAMIYTSTTATSAFSSPSESRECTRHSTELQEWGK